MTNLANIGRQPASAGGERSTLEESRDASVVTSTGGDASVIEGAGAGDPNTSQQRRSYRMLRLILAVIRVGPVLILAALVVTMTVLSPVFLTTGNIGNVLSQTAAIAVLAIGQLLVILTRGIDLSVGSNLA